MANSDGPWRPKDEDAREPPPAPRGRLTLWLLMVAAIAAGVALLLKAFPDAVDSAQGKYGVAYSALLLAVLTAGVFRAGQIRWAEKARHAAIWGVIVAVIAVGFAYRFELADVVGRVRGEIHPANPLRAGARELVVTQDGGGSFFVMGKVNGQPVRFLIDTGASDTVLSPADARRIGIDPASLTFDRAAETANGVGYGAAFVADSLQIGSIGFSGMPMTINQAPMSTSLLGMSFLRRLESFHVRGNKLYLRAHES